LRYNHMGVRTQGGVWDRELVIRIIKKHNLDVVFVEDDWFSIKGILQATKFWEKKFAWLSPVDSYPVHNDGLKYMKVANKLFVPTNGAKTYLKGQGVNSIYLPHGVRTDVFKPMAVDREDTYTFVWIGRDDNRKALGRTILAYEQFLKMGGKAFLLVRADWTTPNAERTYVYIKYRNLPVIVEQMQDIPHDELAKTYNRGDCYICSSKAGGFELGIIEANACGLPALVTDHTFMNELVVQAKSGWRIPIEKITKSQYGSYWGNIDVAKLAERMMFMSKNPDYTKQMGLYAIQHVKQNYTWNNAGQILHNELTKCD